MHFPDMKKSQNLKKKSQNHGISNYLYGKIMENLFGGRAHYPKKFPAMRTSSNDNGKIDIVCFNIGGEGVAKREMSIPH